MLAIRSFSRILSKYNRGVSTSQGILTKVAVVLSGSGVYDGSEIHEASACWVHLSRAGADVAMFAPDKSQMHVINHGTGQVADETRNVLTESARLARGPVRSLSDLSVASFDAVVFPGGFGAAKNLSSFAVDGPNMTVIPDVERVLKDFHSSQKPIGLCCIAPTLAAKVLNGVSVTVGSDDESDPRWPYAGAAGACRAMGAEHVNTELSECHVDEKNKVVTSAAFMCDAPVHEVHDNVKLMIDSVLELSRF